MTAIGNVKLASPWLLAPMAGFTDAAMRTLCEEQGAALTYTEMVSAKGLYYGSSKTEEITYIPEGAGPTAIQIFGSEPDVMAYAARALDDLPNAVLDINMGCPVPKVVRNGEGSALMQDPGLVYDIVKAAVGAASKPVTVKIRKGFDDDHVNAVELAKIAEDNGAAAVTVHGRTRQQFYSGKADWSVIRRVKETVSIPVIGNGDICSGQTAVAMKQQTGCDGVMIARAARGNPWIFREVRAALAGDKIPERPDVDEVCGMMLRHAVMQAECFGEHMGVMQMRKQFAWYTTGMKGAAALRREVNQANTLEELKILLTKLKESGKIL